MKKSIIALSVAVLLSAGVASAQTQRTDQQKAATEQVQKPDQQKQVEISKDKLPESVQKTLQSAKFKDWEVSKVYRVGEESVKPTYKVVLVNGEKKAEYKFDESGAVIG